MTIKKYIILVMIVMMSSNHAKADACSFEKEFGELNALVKQGVLEQGTQENMLGHETFIKAKAYLFNCALEEAASAANGIAMQFEFSELPMHPRAPRCSYEVGPAVRYCNVNHYPQKMSGPFPNGELEICFVAGVYFKTDYTKLVDQEMTKQIVSGLPLYFINDHVEICW